MVFIEIKSYPPKLDNLKWLYASYVVYASAKLDDKILISCIQKIYFEIFIRRNM